MGVLIKNGNVVTASDSYVADIFIQDGIIKEIGLNLEKEGSKVIDAKGLIVMPGGVDVHTHFDLDVGIAIANDDFYTGTVAAACGGTTTIVDHLAFGPKGCNLSHQINKYHSLSKDKAVIDYGFHGVVQDVNKDILKEMEYIVENEGVTSFKIYLTYDYLINDYEAIKVLKKLKELGGIMAVHAENDGVIKFLKEYYLNNNFKSPKYHPLTRPNFCEGEAVNRMINLSSIIGGGPLYIVHLSTKEGLDYIKEARDRGEIIISETCPQYLLLDDSEYDREDALKFIMSPPLRKKDDIEALWSGIKDGFIQVVATDHCPFAYNGDKMLGKDDFSKCPNGAPGVEERIPILFSEGVLKGKISINKFVDVCSTKPAKLFGLYPKKGSISVGSDGDITIIDPNKEVTIDINNLHYNCDYSLYEGKKIKGYPVYTISRGEIIFENEKFIGEKGRGEFIKRKRCEYEI